MDLMEVYGYTYDCRECALEPNPKKITNGVYAHGELDVECGYDLVWIPNEGIHLTKETVEKVIFVYPDGKKILATLFGWKTEDELYYKGIVVKSGDTEAEAFAEQKYKDRSEWL